MAWACRCGSSIRSEAARSGGPVIFKKILVLLERALLESDCVAGCNDTDLASAQRKHGR